MTFELPDLTALIAVVAVAAILSVVLVAASAVLYLTRNRTVRVARREPLLSYYGHRLVGH